MKNILHISALSIAMITGTIASAQADTGLTTLTVSDARTDRPLEGFLRYPTHASKPAMTEHGNVVWQGIQAITDAPLPEGRHPFVVLSHGMYGNAMNQSWLADALVDEGYIVAAISHPGTSTWLRDPDQARQLWDRPVDITRVIDHALSDPTLAQMIDPDRIFMGGHSLGGFTAVALAGGRFDAAGFEAFCAAREDRELVCGIMDRWEVAKSAEDIKAMEADLSDPRIKGFAVFDLGGTQTFSPDSLAEVQAQMLVFGAPRDIAGLDLDIESRALVAALPEANTTYLEPAGLSHFDFLGVCNPGALKILAEEEPGDEVICVQGGADRQKDHQMIVDAVVEAFER